MSDYNDFISQFEILDNPPQKKGFHRHHIVPVSVQTTPDNRQVYLTKAQHLWAHWLYDLEYNTKTIDRLLSAAHMTKKDISSYDDCLPFNDVPESRIGLKPANAWKKGQIGAFYGRKHSQESKEKMSHSHKGATPWNKGIPMSKESKEKLSQSHTGRKASDKTKSKMSESGKKAWEGNENRRQIVSAKIKGRKHFTNGVKEVMSFECPDGYWPGRLLKKRC